MSTATKPRRQKPAPSTNGHVAEPIERYEPALPLSSIVPSPTNPRKTFAQAELQELADSIKAQGVLQAILVRPLYSAADQAGAQRHGVTVPSERFEIVVGERRYRAAKLAGLTTIRAIIREMTDLEVLEGQRLENLQRQDLSPVEEAAGYQLLLDEHGYTVERIAEKLGKSTGYVYGRLKLAGLPPTAAEAVCAGRIPVTTAQLIARIPNPAARVECTQAILTESRVGYSHGRDNDPGPEPMSFREAKEHIARVYMIELKGAPFAQKDATLVASAGACTVCPKKAANNREDYPDARGDTCCDPDCYRQKVAAHHARLTEKARKQGFEVMGDYETRGTFAPDGSIWQSARWVDLEAVFANGKKKQQTYRELVGRQLEHQTLAAIDPKGKLRYVAPARAVEQELRAAGLLPPASANGLVSKTGGPSAEEMAPPAAAPEPEPAKPKGPTPHAISHRAAAIAGQTLYEIVSELSGLEALDDDTVGSPMEALRLVCLGCAWEMSDGAEGNDLAYKVVTLMDSPSMHDDGDRSALAPFKHFVNRAGPAQLLGFLLKAFTIRMLTYPESATMPNAAAQALLDFGELDIEQLREQAKRELSGGEPEPQKLPTDADVDAETWTTSPAPCATGRSCRKPGPQISSSAKLSAARWVNQAAVAELTAAPSATTRAAPILHSGTGTGTASQP
jgi:ParB/RepB/Spo0J family partition protein